MPHDPMYQNPPITDTVASTLPRDAAPTLRGPLIDPDLRRAILDEHQRMGPPSAPYCGTCRETGFPGSQHTKTKQAWPCATVALIAPHGPDAVYS